MEARYDRERLRVKIALWLIAHEVRTLIIHEATRLSEDRIRRLSRDDIRGQRSTPVRRRRGKPPRQMSYFRRTPAHELEAATLVSMFRCGGLLARTNAGQGLSLEEVARFCDVFETFEGLGLARTITAEHAWYLLQTLSRDSEFVLVACRDCHSLWIRDTLELLPYNCPACRLELYPH